MRERERERERKRERERGGGQIDSRRKGGGNSCGVPAGENIAVFVCRVYKYEEYNETCMTLLLQLPTRAYINVVLQKKVKYVT